MAHFFSGVRWPGWIKWLCRELAPFPGRDLSTFRLMISVALTVIISMAVQVPQLAFSAFFVFFVSKENRVLTLITGVVMMVGVTVAVGISLLLFRFTFDHPELRVPVMGLSIFTGMFLSRVLSLGPLGFVIGFIIALLQTVGETAPNTEALVRGSLWLWVAIVYPIALTVIINQVLLPAHPWDVFVRGVGSRLQMTAAVLSRMLKDGFMGGQTNPALMEMATRGVSGLFAMLGLAESQDAQLKQRHVSYAALIGATEHLAYATAAMEFREPAVAISANDRRCAENLLAELTRLEKLSCHPILIPNKAERIVADLPQLREVQLAVEAFHDGLIKRTPSDSSLAAKPVKKPLLAPDAFTNPSYVRFALKVTLAAMVSYLIYTGLGWPGISTSFVTCCFIALENTGATMRKGWLRIIGCSCGGLLGFLAIFFLIPHMESIVSLIFLTAAGSAIMGWIAMGSERISYAGLQGAFAFYLCIFQGFEPQVNFTTIRDRIVGIMLGIIVSSIVFHYVWPEHAIDRLRSTLAQIWRSLAKLLDYPKTGLVTEPEKHNIDKIRSQIRKELDDTLRLSELSMFEHVRTVRRSKVDNVTANTQALVLMTGVLFDRTKLEEWEQLEKPVQDAEMILRSQAAQQLKGIATFLETRQPPELSGLTSAFSTWNQTLTPENHNDRIRLVRRVVERLGVLSDQTLEK